MNSCGHDRNIISDKSDATIDHFKIKRWQKAPEKLVSTHVSWSCVVYIVCVYVCVVHVEIHFVCVSARYDKR